MPLLSSLLLAGVAMQAPVLSGGPMLAYSEMADVAVWTQIEGSGEVGLRYQPISRLTYSPDAPQAWKPVESTRWTNAPAIRTGPAQDGIATFRIGGLEPGTRYRYELTLNGRNVARPYPLEFWTQPHWRWAKSPAEPPNFQFTIGSCMYLNKADTDRPGNPYGGDYEILASMANEKSDFMVWLGDNTYYREMDWLTEAGMRRRWRFDRSQPELRPLLAAYHHYATWDDHDFGPNDSDASFRLKDVALRVFADYWPSVVYGIPGTPGCFYRFEWADAEFFLLDDRTYRTPNRWLPESERQMYGAAQLEWLKQSLVNSDAAFKFVVSGGQMTQSKNMTFFEGFANAPSEREPLFAWLAASNVRGVVFLSGDRHATELLKTVWPGAKYPWYEFTSSPITSGAGRNAREENNPARVPGTWVTRTRNYGTLAIAGPRGQRILTMKTKDKDGKTLWTHTVPEAELREAR